MWASGYDTVNEWVYRSTDGGATFSPRGRPTMGYALDALVADPVDANRVILASLAPCSAWDGGVVWQSTNQGTSWALLLGPGNCSEVAVSLQFGNGDPSRLYFATQGSGGFWASENAGSTWEVRNQGIHSYPVRYVRSDGAGHVYARGFDLRLVGTDPSAPWTNHPPEYWSEPTGFEVSRGTPGLLYECGTSFPSDVGEPFAAGSEDFGDNWTPPPGSLPPGMDSYPYRYAPAWNDHTVYLLGSGGIYRSDDANQSYQQVSPIHSFGCAAVDPADEDHLFAGQWVNPVVMESVDGGATWSPRADGLPFGNPLRIEVDPTDSDHLVVAIVGAGIYETLNGGASWSLLFAYTGDLNDAAWDPVLGYVYLATAAEGIVTDDPGVADGFPMHRVRAVAYDAASRSLVAGTDNGLYVTGLLEPAEVGEDESTLPSRLSLRVAPVPARESVTIELRRTEGVSARVDIVDVNGRIVRRLYEGAIAADQRLEWDTRDQSTRLVPAGLYWVRATVSEGKQSETGPKQGSTERVLVLR
ncbi:MAG: hypothetical protein KC729_13915 [Candidatus Eisenbacteria bacterium]|uniref:FlgD Ig-like domain-containing protein n=1 Tax=Eiseniibacteriota bacterium TaxID=2212470 RepID=A0A956M243_UNCEI|nr:hypothetical protein [Candidatus Eisenbacteria bacterium]